MIDTRPDMREGGCHRDPQRRWAVLPAITVLLALASTSYAADVNVLIIGSTSDSADSRRINGKSDAFSPTQIGTELQKILAGARLGDVNVVAVDRYTDHDIEITYKERKYRYKVACHNLASWLHFPFPADVETTTRWPDLRGEKGTKWDYVVLIGDPYTIEYLPGLYAHGVAKVAEEVARGGAETVLLMPWPAAGSDSTVAHYKEVVYRAGRSGGYKVAPAALAWEAAGKPAGETHPNQDGAYIAAASIYSRIWNKSARHSRYDYNDALADTAHKTVAANVGAKQYAGRFKFQNPFLIFDDHSRQVAPRSPGGWSSTEDAFLRYARYAIRRARVVAGDRRGSRFLIGRDAGNPKHRKPDYRKQGTKYRSLGFRYHTQSRDPHLHVSAISAQDMDIADQMIAESELYRAIPTRLIWSGLHQLFPGLNPKADGSHVTHETNEAVGTYAYTLFSGRCPMDPKPDPVTLDWIAQKTGYEAAWRLGRCQTRAPGFKVMPSSATRLGVGPGKTETMTVQFIMAPRKSVTVNVSVSDGTAATVSPQTLHFTPENHGVPQQVVVTGKAGAESGAAFDVAFDTSSADEVYNGLRDTWRYTVNNAPEVKEEFRVSENMLTLADDPVSTIATVLAGDADGDKLTYTWKVVTLDRSGRKVSAPKKPVITPRGKEFPGDATITFEAIGNYAILGTVTDGLLPVSKTVYVTVVPPNQTLRDPDNPANTELGLDWTRHDGAKNEVKDTLSQAVAATGTINYPRLRGGEPKSFGYRFTGYLQVSKDGTYTFFIKSREGTQLSIGDTMVVDCKLHGRRANSAHGVIGLKAGKHAISVGYSTRDRGKAELLVEWAGPDSQRKLLDSFSVYRVAEKPKSATR